MNFYSKILVVNSDLSTFVAAPGWLEDAGYTVFQTKNGRSALNLYKKEQPQIVLVAQTDTHQGYALCQEIKSLPTAVSPLLFLAVQEPTAVPDTAAIDDFLLLPLTKQELLLKIKLANRLVLGEYERDLLLNAANALQNLPGSDALLPSVLADLQTLFMADSIGYTAIDSATGESVIKGAYGKLAYLAGKRIPVSSTGLAQLLQNDRPLVIDNFKEWQKSHGINLNGSRLGKTQAFTAVPLKSGKNILGTLWLGSTYKLDPSTERFLKATASLLTTALQQELWMHEVQQTNVELEAHVAERTEELSNAYKRLQDLNHMKSNFVANVSHELRLPLSNLTLYFDLLKNGSPKKQSEYETQISNNIERLHNLVDNILSLSRLEAQMDEMPMKPIDLNDIVEEVVTMVSSSLINKPVRIQFRPNSSLPPVRGRRERLMQIVTNLLSNAVKHTDQGQILVQTKWQAKQETVCLTVSDSGMGILPEDLPNIFNRFYRGRQSVRQQVPGSGLGLAIVREIVEQHNGRIHVKSTPEQGSTFTVDLPTFIL